MQSTVKCFSVQSLGAISPPEYSSVVPTELPRLVELRLELDGEFLVRKIFEKSLRTEGGRKRRREVKSTKIQNFFWSKKSPVANAVNVS